MGWWMFKFRPGKTVEATVIGVILLTLAVIFGKDVPGSFLEPYFKVRGLELQCDNLARSDSNDFFVYPRL
jgi:carbon starvation protein CstA